MLVVMTAVNVCGIAGVVSVVADSVVETFVACSACCLAWWHNESKLNVWSRT